jgi:hypothetical protein
MIGKSRRAAESAIFAISIVANKLTKAMKGSGIEVLEYFEKQFRRRHEAETIMKETEATIKVLELVERFNDSVQKSKMNPLLLEQQRVKNDKAQAEAIAKKLDNDERCLQIRLAEKREAS